MAALFPLLTPATGTAARPAPLHGPAAGKPRLLLVEDDALSRMVAETFVQSLGYTDLHLASNGSEALDLCSRNAYTLVLMDCLMPVMGGLEATRRLRERGVRVPVVALTASTEPDDIARCLEAGMDDHLAKPLDLQRLAATLTHWLAGPASEAGALN